MSSPLPLHRLVLFGLYGTLVGFLIALLIGELVWWLLTPSPLPEAQAFVPSGPVLAHTPLPPPSPRLVITTSPHVLVYPGGQNTFRVRIARAHFDAPVTFKWTSSPPGLSASDLTIPAGQTSGQVVVKAAVDAPPGVYQLTATVGDEYHLVSTTAKMEVTVVKIPPVGARLVVSVSPKIQVYQNSKNAFGVRVARGEFTGDVAIAFSGLPEGVTAPAITIPADKAAAMVELVAEGGVPTGVHTLTVTARRGPTKADVIATAEARVEILGSPKLLMDLVFVLDCTGSMKKSVAGISGHVPGFAAHLRKSQLDVRFGLVGFQDTTLGQPLKILRVNNDKLTTDFAQFGEAMGELRLGGGGGEGESSLDGLAEAADYAFRDGAVRVALLITDGGPKRIDGRMKSMDETVKYLRDKKMNQLHIVALPEHKKPFEPLWAGVKGNFFDLKEANNAGSYDKLMAEVAKSISTVAPPLSVGKPLPAAAAPEPELPTPDSVKPPALPAGAEPDEPKIEQVIAPGVSVVIPATTEKPTEQPEPPKGYPVLALAGWASVVTSLVCLAVLVGHLTFLPGEKPTFGTAAVGYGGGVAVGLLAGAVGYLVFDLVGVPFLGRLSAASVFGLCVGVAVPLVESLLREGALAPHSPDTLPLTLEPELERGADAPRPQDPRPVDATRPPAPSPVKPLELDDDPLPLPVAAVNPAPPIKPNITAPKPADGCPGCGRTIPGSSGERYCMLCDRTF